LRPDRAIGEANLASAPRLAARRPLAVEKGERAIALIERQSSRARRKRRDLAADPERREDFIRDGVNGHAGARAE